MYGDDTCIHSIIFCKNDGRRKLAHTTCVYVYLPTTGYTAQLGIEKCHDIPNYYIV